MRFIPIIPAVTPDMDNTPGKAESDEIIMSDGAMVDNNPKSIREYNEMRKQSAKRGGFAPSPTTRIYAVTLPVKKIARFLWAISAPLQPAPARWIPAAHPAHSAEDVTIPAPCTAALDAP